jgi:autotransporter-associated beta strand protein
VGSAGGTGTFSGLLENGASGILALTKAGAGTQTLSIASTYSGLTRVSGGTLVSGNATAFGSGTLQIDAGGTANMAAFSMANPITMNGGTLALANGATGPITLNNVAGNTFAPNDNYRVLSGVIGGAGGFTVASGGGTPGLTISNTGNNFAGNVTINANTYLRLQNSEVMPDTATVTVNGHLRLEPNNGTETLAGLSGSGQVWHVQPAPGGSQHLQYLRRQPRHGWSEQQLVPHQNWHRHFNRKRCGCIHGWHHLERRKHRSRRLRRGRHRYGDDWRRLERSGKPLLA